ncbi:SDR family NAD(P)-dependent oxidoreductase [Psychromonas sp.]|uniref:SDR family NAD(P)-dependent oxidoreductase n=1 Tax=Psychromonas sp. TaxID=1884585 RepID=UPI003565D270
MSTEQTRNEHDTAEHKQLNSRLQECPIAIVGMASVFAESKNLSQFWDNIVESVNGIQEVPEDRWAVDDYYSADKKAADKTYCKRGGFLPEIDFDPMEFGLPPNILELTDITQLMSLVVARDVLSDAGIADESSYDRDKIGITLGVGGGQKQIGPLTSRLQGPVLDKVLKASGIGAADRDMIIDKFKKAYIPWEENSFPGMLGNVIAGRIANRFNFGGTNCVVDAACAGSLAAIKMAVSDLLEYRSEMMISGGVCCDNSPFMYMSFSKTPAFTDGENIRPFDENSNGMMIGEGVAMIAMKRLQDAERDGDKIYSVIKGIGSSSDGRFKSIYAPRPSGQVKALKRAYQDAGFDPLTCGLVEAHGTGTKAGDAAEFSGLTTLFSENNEQKQHIALGSVKSQVGHTKAAAGTAGLIKIALALHHKVLPPTINVEQPNKNLDIENTPLYINSETRPWMPRADGIKRRAGVSSFGFGGTNFHIVLEEYKSKQTGRYRLNEVPQTILISAPDKLALIESLSAWSAKLAVATELKPYAFNALVTENPLLTPDTESARCAFVAKNAQQAQQAIEQILKQFSVDDSSAWSIASGIFYRQSGLQTEGKIVALFSGQGSQYLNMGADLSCNFPSMLETNALMDREFSDHGLQPLSAVTYPVPVFNAEKRRIQDETLRLTQYAQPAIGAFSAGLYKTFQQAGFKADFAAGHSFGELTALWAAGVVSDQDYMLLARSRGQAMAAPDDTDFDAGTMIAVVGEPAEIAKDIAAIDNISIANYNANNQVVVAGETSQVLSAFEQLQEKGYKVVRLPVSAAFHTELVSHAQKPFADVIDSVEFKSPAIPVFSNGTAAAHAEDPNLIKSSLKKHILESVYFNQEIENLYKAGGRIFIEFGPKNVLTRLVDNILQDKSDVITIAINANPKKSADLQLRLAAVEMAVLGVQLDEIDPYNALPRPTTAVKKSPLAMKLTGAAYVSDKTKKAFQDALNDGRTISAQQAQPNNNMIVKEVPVEKEVIVEKIVEKVVYLNADGTSFENPAVGSVAAQNAVVNNADLVKSIEQSVGQFVEHQAQLLSVHEEYMQGPKEYAKTFQSVLASQAGKAELPESLDKTLAMYHDFQSETLRVHESYLNNQSENMQQILAAVSTGAEISKSTVTTAGNYTQAVDAAAQAAVTTTTVQPATPVSDIVSAETAERSVDLTVIQTVMLDVVADKTGYPVEMLELGMDMEADLGIDSIKRVEILGAVQDQLDDLPELNPEDLAELRTLAEIVIYMQGKAPATTAETIAVSTEGSATAALDLSQIQTVMLDVVADKTGYPAEMLELGMDMEADLGIDSIKRVEILGAVQDQLADLPELNPEDLAELRTLAEIVIYMQGKAPAATAETVSVPVVASAAALDLSQIQTVMLDVVADKTGYPAEMLELGMDMEADLGIDSIKRVEILGAVQDQLADLPELNPEDLAELRTLAEIVTYMQGKAPAVAADVVAPAEAAAPTATLDLSRIQAVMLAVVADKTGYPVEMLELGMDMEADLGIDSIKRVEILGAVQDQLADLPELNPEDLAELRTLAEIVTYMQGKAPAATAETVAVPAGDSATAALDLNQIQALMLAVVADKTGYPVEMLEPGMDMEADLGIDSIKRVEILGAVQDQLADLPELNPEDLAELRTLAEIITYMQGKAPAASVDVVLPAATVEESAAVSAALASDSSQIQAVMLAVVADKTGYPVEMLEPGMDMEADLGIDSIKRVEILGAVQDQLADLPELNPEDLAELRTLAEIVTYMQGKAPAASAADSAPAALDLSQIQTVMLDVVADKTGYPVEMLEPGMDMEADLGIDSIKRVEILGAVQDQLEDLPELNPEELAELRTLAEIVTYMSGQFRQDQSSEALPKNQTAEFEKPADFEPAPSSTVGVQHLNGVEKMEANVNGENLLLVDDGQGCGVRLADKLSQLGWSVTVIQPSWVKVNSDKPFNEKVNVFALNEADEHELITIIATQSLWSSVVYLHPDTEISGIEYPQESKQGLILAFLLAKLSGLAGNKNNNETRSSFLVLTRQGGAFGADNNEHKSDLVQTGLSGLVKTLSHEWPSVFCRAVDVASKFCADKVANIVVDELNDKSFNPVEVGFNSNGRLTLVAEKTDSYNLQPGNTIDQDSVFLVSGGAKGVTAQCVIRLAKQYKCKFILLGRSDYQESEPDWAAGIEELDDLKKAAMQALITQGEKPTPVSVAAFIRPVLANREIKQTLEAVHAVGGIAEYISVDVTAPDSLFSAVSPITDLWGEVSGIIHGAGVLADKFIEQKTLAELSAVYTTKIDGLLSLLACCQQDKLQHLVLFSSAAGFYGNPGQSDYAMANEILNKTAYRFKGLYPHTQVLSFNWGPWDGGMVTPELKRMFDQRGVYIIPMAAGAELLLNELAADSNRCPQILVGNDMSGQIAAENNAAQASFKKPLVSRLVKKVLAADNPFLADHQIGQHQVLPTVCAIAWMVEAVKNSYPDFVYLGLENYQLFKGIVFDGNQADDYIIEMAALDTEGENLRVNVKIASEKTDGSLLFHYQATLLWAKENQSAPLHYGELPGLVLGKQANAAALYKDGTLFHGSSLQGIQALLHCDSQGLLLSCLIAGSVQRKQGEFNLQENNIFANDLVYQALLIWVRQQLGLGSLPSSTLSWTVYSEVKLDRAFYLQLTISEQAANKVVADIKLIDRNKQIMAEISGVEVNTSASLNHLFHGHAK